MIKDIKSDFSRYCQIEYGGNEMSFFKKLQLWTHSYGLQVLAAQRFFRWSLGGSSIPARLGKLPCACLGFVLYKVSGKLYDITISRHAEIGAGCYIGHFGGVRIGPCNIGTFCNINHQVTIGEIHQNTSNKTIIIGNRVWIGAHSSIKGPLRIGNNVTISAASVIKKDIQGKVLVAGPSGRILQKGYDNSLLLGLTKQEK